MRSDSRDDRPGLTSANRAGHRTHAGRPPCNRNGRTLGGSIEFGPVDETSSAESDPTVETGKDVIGVETEIDWSGAQLKGTFEVTDGAGLLGCSSGMAVEFKAPSGITNVFTCDDGDRKDAFQQRWG
jgi:hypothetical protein